MRTSLFWACVVVTVAGAVSPAPAQKNEGIRTLMPPLMPQLTPPVASPAPPTVALPPPPPKKDALDLPTDDLKAFEHLRALTAKHVDDDPNRPESRVVAKAFVALANFYLKGIPNSPVQADPKRARDLFAYAATYFRDPEAQYLLGRLDLEGIGGPPNALQAARWLSLAAKNEQHQAQALLGRILVNGEGVPRQAARGLMFLMLARDGAPEEAWIGALFDAAFKQASADEQAQSLVLLEGWLKGSRN
jgi:exopolysaccharide production negative regulator